LFAYIHAIDTTCLLSKLVVLELFVLMAHLGYSFAVTQKKNCGLQFVTRVCQCV